MKNKPQLDAKGREIIPPHSLAIAGQLRSVSLGERIRRYMRTPQYLQDLQNQDGYHPDDLEELDFKEGELVSVHDDRYKELQELNKKRQKEIREKEKADLIEKEKAERDNFRKRMREIKAEEEAEKTAVRSSKQPSGDTLPDTRETEA